MSVRSPVEVAERAPFLSDEDFAARMDCLAPFETAPHLVVAVSGGGDSMALVRLVATWAKARGGRVTALTVDHGLRAESLAEARQVADWMARQGVDHETLVWTGPRPRSGIQAAARAARYALLEEWCRRAGALHLLLAHTRDDQAETLVLRIGRKSGSDGLAGMAAVVERADVRLLRPLLAVQRDALRGTLRRLNQAWIEDPSNCNDVFARVRIRRSMPAMASCGLTSGALAAAAAGFGSARRYLESATATALAQFVRCHPAGLVRIDLRGLTDVDEEIGRRILARCLMAVGGNVHAPRRDRLDRLFAVLSESAPKGRAATLGGCRLLPHRGSLLVCRETRGVAAPMRIVPGGRLAWDGRFVVTALPGAIVDDLWIGALGCSGWREIAVAAPEVRRHPLPAQARPTLPALRDRRGIVAVPHLDFVRADRRTSCAWHCMLRFRPLNSLSGMGFSRFSDDALLLI